MYLYHAHAIAFEGAVERPSPQTIAALGSCSLAPSGGTSSAREGKFDNGLISFDSARTDLTGSVETQNGKTTYVSGVSVCLCGLNIRNVIMADQVVMRIAGAHDQPPIPAKGKSSSPWEEARIITTGCHFDNLKIAGHPVTAHMDHKIFHDYPTHGELQSAWQSGGKERPRITSRLVGSGMKALGPGDPDHLHEIHRGFDEQKKAPALKQTVLFSFIQKLDGIDGAEIDNWGSIVRIPQFGTIYLGEVLVSPGHRCVHMFRLHLGSPDGAGFNGPSGSTGGNGFPP